MVLLQNFMASWWNWNQGSRLIFWRWNGVSQQTDALFGLKIFVKHPPPLYTSPACPPGVDILEQVQSKILKVIDHQYIALGHVKALIDYFAVPKGPTDIRLVYNGTSSGLNAALWAPSFWLPTSSSAAPVLSFNSFCVDLDLGDMFLNFPMDPAIWPFLGVDVSPFRKTVGPRIPLLPLSRPLWLRWERLFMGMTPSPYNAVTHFYLAEELAHGAPSDKTNPCRYDEVRLNIPGAKDYCPSLPWVMKWNVVANDLAGDVVMFVDNLRATGYSVEYAWQVGRQVASRLQHLGIQDAPRK